MDIGIPDHVWGTVFACAQRNLGVHIPAYIVNISIPSSVLFVHSYRVSKDDFFLPFGTQEIKYIQPFRTSGALYVCAGACDVYFYFTAQYTAI